MIEMVKMKRATKMKKTKGRNVESGEDDAHL
jgi:hypothetical protein